jgi:hypothetical protein
LIRFLLSLSVLVGCVAADICAQTSSSASQSVTFGVHRSAPVVLASAQTTTVSVKETGLEHTSPLKITIGSESRSHVVSEMSTVVSQRSFAEYKSSLPGAKSFSIKSLRAENPVVTLTE